MSAAPNVLFAHPTGDRYGADTMLAETVRAVIHAGGGATVCLSDGGPLVAELAAVGATVEIVDFPVLRQAMATARGVAALGTRSGADVRRLSAVISRLKPDLVYVNNVTTPHWLAAAKLARVPSICHVHEADPAGAGRVKRTMLLSPLSMADMVVANSRHTAASISAIPWLRRPARVVYNGFDMPEPTPITSPSTVVVIGRLNPRKGQSVAIAAMARLRRRDRDVTLHIAGDVFPGYEWVEADLHNQVEELGLDGAVVFDGFRDRWEAYADAGIVAVPSLLEPFGNVAAEAMAAGRPVVASDVGGLAEIVEDGVTGLLVAPADPAALAAAIERLLDDPAEAASMGQAGARVARERYSSERYREEMVALIREAATRGKWRG